MTVWFIIEQRASHGDGWVEVDRAGHPGIAEAIAEQLRSAKRATFRPTWWPVTPRDLGIRVREDLPLDGWSECRQPVDRTIVRWGSREMFISKIEPDALCLGHRGRVLLRPVNGRGPERFEPLVMVQRAIDAAQTKRRAS